ncbi:MAG: DM13 domain-containing protein [Polyangiales bacterium]|nr:DM13 domain-containing protein [Myxococcales bacterium]
MRRTSATGKNKGFRAKSTGTGGDPAAHRRHLPWGLIALLAVPWTLTTGCASEDEPSRYASRGEALFHEPFEDGNSFACATCHAVDEPAADGIRRVGHPLRDAANRPSWKNGQVTSLRAAVNSCLTEWMRADAVSEESDDWRDLGGYLEELAGDAPGAAVTFEVLAPPAELSGGDVDEGRTIFNASCSACHGTDATGTTRAPSLVGSALSPERIAERVRLSGSATSAVYDGLTGGAMPFWAADRLSDEELIDLVAYTVAIGEMGDGGVGGGNGGDGGIQGRQCASTHPAIGKTAALSTFAHAVDGTATIVDDCTIRFDDFSYDGGGIDVRIYAGKAGDYDPPTGFAISPNIKGVAFRGETFAVQLPEGKSLDDLDGVAVWCTDVGVSFGDGLFK